MKLYLSHGMGVNSTALMLLLEDLGFKKFENIFVDTGAEHPETYEYLSYLQRQGYEITVLKPNVEGFSNLYDYCKYHKVVPGKNMRWCTDKFKVRPLRNYVKAPAVIFVAIASDEAHRVIKKPLKKGVIRAYPLVDYNINRQKCIEIIKEHGLKVPRKSGCWLCPFKRKEEIRELYLKYPELYEKRKEIEALALERSGGKSGYLIYAKTTEEWAMEKIHPLESFLQR